MNLNTIGSVTAKVINTLRSSSPVRIMASTSTSTTIKEELNEEMVIESTPSPKKKRVMKPKPPKVYVIPPVETLTTTFKGRLGYACLNTVLRDQKPSIFCSRTCRIATIKEKGMDYLKELGRLNVQDLSVLIQWNFDHHIFFLRISSEIFPFASHKEYGYTLEHAAKELKEAGDLAKRLGIRLTTHPGQYCALGSDREEVVVNATRDLTYHNEMFERMGLGEEKDSVMIIHGGGMYGDKVKALQRFRDNYLKLPKAIQDRLVLENDEICYNVDDLLPLCEELGIPLCYDYHHGWLFPSKESVSTLMPRILATWTRKGIKVKQHLSSPRKGAVGLMELRAHSDRCQTLPDELPDDMDLMIEAKDKEQAVFHLYRIYNLYPTIHDDLRPPADEETTQTAGRKSSGKKKKALKGEDGEEEEMLEAVEEGTPTKSKPKSPRKSRAKVVVKVEVEVEDYEEVEEEEDLDEGGPSEEEEVMPKKKNRKVAS